MSNLVTSLMVRRFLLLLNCTRSLAVTTDVALIQWNWSGVPVAEQLSVTELLNSIKSRADTVMVTFEIGSGSGRNVDTYDYIYLLHFGDTPLNSSEGKCKMDVIIMANVKKICVALEYKRRF